MLTPFTLTEEMTAAAVNFRAMSPLEMETAKPSVDKLTVAYDGATKAETMANASTEPLNADILLCRVGYSM